MITGERERNELGSEGVWETWRFMMNGRLEKGLLKEDERGERKGENDAS